MNFLVIPVTQSISQVVVHLLILHVANLGQNIVRRWMKEKPSVLRSGRRGKTEQILGGGEEGDGEIERTACGDWSQTSGMIHSDQQMGGRGTPWQMQRCLFKKGLWSAQSCRTVDFSWIHPIFRTSLRSPWGGLGKRLSEVVVQRPRHFQASPTNPGQPWALLAPGGLAENARSALKSGSSDRGFLSLLLEALSPLPHFPYKSSCIPNSISASAPWKTFAVQTPEIFW